MIVAEHIIESLNALTERVALLERIEQPAAIATRLSSSSDIVIPASTLRTLTFDTERYDAMNMHTSALPSRLTAPISGYYDIWANISFQPNITGRRQVIIRVNNTRDAGITLEQAVTQSGIPTIIEARAVEYMNVGDYAECQLFQQSGANVSALTASSYSPDFGMFLIRKP